MDNLPKGFTVRAPTWDDAERVNDLIIKADIDEFGEPDYSVEDLLGEWRRADFDLGTDAWLILAPDGSLAGYTDMWDGGHYVHLSTQTCVDPAYKQRGIEEWCMGNAEAWAREHVQDRAVVIQYVINADQPDKVERVTRWGYQSARHDWVMRIMLDQAIPELTVSEGIILRPFERGRDERAVWACIQEAFRDTWNHPDHPYEQWSAWLMENAYWSPELSYLAQAGDEIVGATMAFDYPNEGWIRQLGVRRPWRKQGVGLALLHTIFREFQRRAKPRAGLAVDSQSLTGALRLYERAGMRVVNHFTRYQKELV